MGNSLTGITSYFKSFARTAGYPHESAMYTRPGAWTKELWDASLTQDKDGHPVVGTDAVTEITDIWTFERDLANRDPVWRLVSARSA